MTERLGQKIQLVSDDIFVANPQIIARAIREGVANAVLIKLSARPWRRWPPCARPGTASSSVSHRSGETPDDFIADFVVATSAGQIKTGAPCRGERVAKYNQLVRIEHRTVPEPFG